MCTTLVITAFDGDGSRRTLTVTQASATQHEFRVTVASVSDTDTDDIETAVFARTRCAHRGGRHWHRVRPDGTLEVGYSGPWESHLMNTAVHAAGLAFCGCSGCSGHDELRVPAAPVGSDGTYRRCEEAS